VRDLAVNVDNQLFIRNLMGLAETIEIELPPFDGEGQPELPPLDFGQPPEIDPN
jgi:hypothetical protein